MDWDRYEQLLDFLNGTWDIVDLAQTIHNLFPELSKAHADQSADSIANMHFSESYDIQDVVHIIEKHVQR